MGQRLIALSHPRPVKASSTTTAVHPDVLAAKRRELLNTKRAESINLQRGKLTDDPQFPYKFYVREIAELALIPAFLPSISLIVPPIHTDDPPTCIFREDQLFYADPNRGYVPKDWHVERHVLMTDEYMERMARRGGAIHKKKDWSRLTVEILVGQVGCLAMKA